MRLIPLAAAVALILFISAPSFAQEWIEYANRGDFFSVNLPSQPKVKEITYGTEYAITLPGHVYTAEDGPSRYSVTVIDYTDTAIKHADHAKSCRANGGEGDQCRDRTAIDLQAALDYAAWNLMQKAAKVTHFVYTEADQVAGHEVHLANADGTRTFAMVYMHENRLYILEGTVPADDPPPLLFQQSMRFLDKDGAGIRYDSTYFNGFPAPRRAR